MKFYFCETCGKRINDGEVRNKGLKGWYCGDCAQGVMTVEMTALSDAQAKRALEKARADPPVVHVSQRPATAARSREEKKSNKIGISILFLIASVALAGIVIYTAIRGKPPEDSGVAQAATSAPAATPTPANRESLLLQHPEANPGVPKAITNESPATLAAPQGEVAAQLAFDELERSLRNMESASNADKIKLIEKYLNTYNDYIIASRARLLIANLEQPETARVDQKSPHQTPTQKPAESSPPIAADAAAKKDLLQRLKDANPQFDGTGDIAFERGRITVVRLDGRQVSDISALKGLDLSYVALHRTKVLDLAPLSGMKIWYLGLQNCPVSDLKPLAGISLTRLDLTRSKVADLSPLDVTVLSTLDAGYSPIKDLSPLRNATRLTSLDLSDTGISDLAPLKGLPLTHLDIGGTNVKEISALAGMPLEYLRMKGINIENLSVLKGMRLKGITCTFVPQRHTAVLKSIPTLKTINGKAVDMFWKEVEKK